VKNCKRLRQTAAGFTLVELLVVIAILGVLAAVLAVNYTGILGGAKHKIAVQEVAKVKELLEQYKVLSGNYPSQQDGLAALTKPLPGQSDALLNSSKVTDPWGHAYVYVFPGQHGKFDLVCLGADGVEGGDGENADIYSWDDSAQQQTALK
jgi:general secretion pathway protein G